MMTMFPKEQIKTILDKESEKWLSGHTKFYLGLTVDDILALRTENARLRQELAEAISGRKDAISQAIMDWNISDPPFPYLNEQAIVDLITMATTAIDYAAPTLTADGMVK